MGTYDSRFGRHHVAFRHCTLIECRRYRVENRVEDRGQEVKSGKKGERRERKVKGEEKWIVDEIISSPEKEM